MTAACARASYRRREPEHTVLHEVLRAHLTTFLATNDVPRHVRRTLRGYVDCGVLAKGFSYPLRSISFSEAAPRSQLGLRNGRFGMAVFQGGPGPATVLWLTVTPDAVCLWTWLGPDLRATELALAVGCVMTARRRVG